MIVDILQLQLGELVLVQKRDKMAEDKAQSYKKLFTATRDWRACHWT